MELAELTIVREDREIHLDLLDFHIITHSFSTQKQIQKHPSKLHFHLNPIRLKTAQPPFNRTLSGKNSLLRLQVSFVIVPPRHAIRQSVHKNQALGANRHQQQQPAGCKTCETNRRASIRPEEPGSIPGAMRKNQPEQSQNKSILHQEREPNRSLTTGCRVGTFLCTKLIIIKIFVQHHPDNKGSSSRLAFSQLGRTEVQGKVRIQVRRNIIIKMTRQISGNQQRGFDPCKELENWRRCINSTPMTSEARIGDEQRS